MIIIISNILIWQAGSVILCCQMILWWSAQVYFLLRWPPATLSLCRGLFREMFIVLRSVPRLARNLPLAQLEVFNSSVRSRYRARPNLQRGRASKSARQELICMIDPALCGMKKKKKKKEDDKIKYSRLQSHRKQTDQLMAVSPTGHSCCVVSRSPIWHSASRLCVFILEILLWWKESQAAMRTWRPEQ